MEPEILNLKLIQILLYLHMY